MPPLDIMCDETGILILVIISAKGLYLIKILKCESKKKIEQIRLFSK